MKLDARILALLAALLFGASAPFSKLLLIDFKPIQLAGFLYLGSGLGLSLIKLFQVTLFKHENYEAKINKNEIKWLAGAVICGGILAPIILMMGLSRTPASTTSLLLNFEAVSTAIIAFIFFKEQIGKKLWLSIMLITIASIILSLDLTGKWGLSIGSIGILIACVLWGLDNNFTRNISMKDPYIIVIVKGMVSGTFSIILSMVLGYKFPEINKIIYGLVLGSITYGLSLFLFVLALRNLGSSRTSAFFGLAPFLGAIISLLVFKEFGNILFYISLPFMILGAYLLFYEKHDHIHIHNEWIHEHKHGHDDKHHKHKHKNDEVIEDEYHTHLHKHEIIEHKHEHFPDIHHRHVH